MASQFRLVSAIVADVRYRADIQGQLDRHTDANLVRLFNESVQQLRTRLVNLGYEGLLKATTPAALSTTAAATGETFSEESWPIDAQRIYGVHVLFQTSLWLPLRPITISDIRDFQLSKQPWAVFGVGGTEPAAFALREAPLGAAAVETVGKLIIVPKPTVARSFRIWYLQNWTDLALTDTFNGMSGHIEWIIWDIVIKVSARDNDSNETHAIAQAERAHVEGLLAADAPRTQMAASVEPRRADEDELWDNYSPRALP